MDKVVDELANKLSNVSFDALDDIINRMEKMKIRNNRDKDVEGLIMAMGSLSTVPNNKKLDVALEGVRRHKKRVFARKYKSLSGKKQKISEKQIVDIFNTMSALKGDNDSFSVDDFDWGDDTEMEGGRRKAKKGGAKRKAAKKKAAKKKVAKKKPKKKVVKKKVAKKSKK